MEHIDNRWSPEATQTTEHSSDLVLSAGIVDALRREIDVIFSEIEAPSDQKLAQGDIAKIAIDISHDSPVQPDATPVAQSEIAPQVELVQRMRQMGKNITALRERQARGA